MYDQVTLGLNVDPFILSALKEDITSEDVSTNSVMPDSTPGVVDLICKEDGIICGLQVFERVFTLLDPSTRAEFYVKDGDHVENKQLVGKIYGDIRVLLCGERTALNYLQRMSGIATYTSQVAALLEGTGIKIYETQNKTGNKVLDTILTSKSMHCQRHGIELKFMGEGQLLNFMEDMDISALFGNMLDNAIESVVKIKDRQKRLISLHVIQDKQFIRIRTENYCEENVQFQDGIPITTKKDKRFHGYGMKSMKKIVEKYGGSVMAGKANNWFELKILIPMKH